MALRGAVLPGHPAGEPFTHTHYRDEVVDGRPPTCRAQKFPEAISFNAAFSNSAISQQPLQRRVLPLQVLQPFRVVSLQPTELVTPPVLRLLRHLQFTADTGDILALTKQPISLAELADHPLRCMPFPRRHRDQTFLPNAWAARLSPNLDQPAEVTSSVVDQFLGCSIGWFTVAIPRMYRLPGAGSH